MLLLTMKGMWILLILVITIDPGERVILNAIF